MGLHWKHLTGAWKRHLLVCNKQQKRSIRNKSTQTGEFVICHTDMLLTAQTVRIICSSRTFLSNDGILMEFTGSVQYCAHVPLWPYHRQFRSLLLYVSWKSSALNPHCLCTWRRHVTILIEDQTLPSYMMMMIAYMTIFIGSWVSSKSPSCSITELVCILYYN